MTKRRLVVNAVAAAMLALPLAAPAASQTASMGTADWLEANRPSMQPRKLTADETRQVSQLVKGFEQSVKEKQPDESWLIRLRPLAEAGDRTALKAMISGYNNLWNLEPGRRNPLAALWSVEYWKLHGPDPQAGKHIRGCISGSSRDGYWVGKTSSWDCGFDVKVKPDRFNYSGFEDYAEGKGPAPRNVTFVARSLAIGGAADKARFENLVSILKGGGALNVLDRTWAKEYADKTGPAEIAALQAALDDHPNAVARLGAVNQQIAAERRAGQLQRWTVLHGKDPLTPMELEEFEDLSIVLGPEQLAKFGEKYVIYGETHINAACTISAWVCGEQRAMFDQRRARAEAEARARNAPIGDWAGQLFVDVRTYDQNGMFVGTQTMTRSQADTIGARPN